MSELSYFSTLEDVISAADEDLRSSIGYLSPDTVVEYVFYLRGQTSSYATENSALREKLKHAETEKNRLQIKLDEYVDLLKVKNTPPTAPPLYESISQPESSGTGNNGTLENGIS